MKGIRFLLFVILFACKSEDDVFEKYAASIGFDPERPTLLVSLENCEYCFSVFNESLQEIQGKDINIVIISSQEKKANLLAKVDGKSTFLDRNKEALRLGLIESLPVLFLSNQEKETVETPEKLLDLIQKNVP
jgi:thioredoxin-related protein